MKGIVCQTFSFCRIHIDVRERGRFGPPPLLGLRASEFFIGLALSWLSVRPHSFDWPKPWNFKSLANQNY